MRVLSKFILIFTASSVAIWALGLSAACANEISGFSAEVGLNHEEYLDAKSPDLTDGKFFIISYENMPFLAYKTNGKLTYLAQIKFQHESSSEIYDNDRYKTSPHFNMDLSTPISKIGDDAYLTFWLNATGSENAPQLTDVETRAALGIGASQNLAVGEIQFNFSARAGVMNYSHEYDDERPLKDFGFIERQEFKTGGVGPVAKIVAEAYFNDAFKVEAEAQHYSGQFNYENDKSMRRSDIGLKGSYQLHKKWSCSIGAFLTVQKREKKFFNLKDELATVSASCKRWI